MQWIERHNKVLTAVVWVIRIVVGATFVFSGFVKAVDPWGFMYKITDYLTVWGIDYIPREAIFCLAASLAGIEFMLGMLVALGCLRRAAVWMLRRFYKTIQYCHPNQEHSAYWAYCGADAIQHKGEGHSASAVPMDSDCSMPYILRYFEHVGLLLAAYR